MRKIFTIVFSSFLFTLASAQAYEGTVEYQKKDEKAIVIEFPIPPSVVEDAIIDKMEKLGFKKKESKGFLVYKNAVIPEISIEPADYMFRVERKSRKDKDESEVYLIMNRNNENIIARGDAFLNSNAKTFLNQLTPVVQAWSLEVQIKDQEEQLAKAEKKLKNLQDDLDDMERKIKKLEQDMRDNGKDQENQKKEIDKQRQVLEAMRAKRQM